VSLALYRTYRPGRLADVIGQEHVTIPLGRAIDTGRAHHAYLFTGPRGCGKTSTARILARSLNCEKGPTSEPCGECASCQDLAPNGPGSLDVVEMDAASHRGIDDARELREKAMYAPASSRYKVYIIDEAHQLTVDAANALLKLIEEPPPHLMFVFATTEPDKILATIRSRTHHYPYRLVGVRRLQEHLGWVAEQEGVPAQPEALALVARAAAGSVRDALSILGQLVAGTGPEGLTYADAVAQLGFTDASLLDEAIDALADADGAAMFSVVDRVVDGGLDPRRFATDLLERLRDLVVLHEVPDAVEAGLLDAPDGQIAIMRAETERLGLAQLSRAADLVSTGLSELKGATAPRLQLELLCARLLLPAIDDSSSGLLARLDRLEHRIAYLGDVPAGAGAVGQATRPAATSQPPASSASPVVEVQPVEVVPEPAGAATRVEVAAPAVPSAPEPAVVAHVIAEPVLPPAAAPLAASVGAPPARPAPTRPTPSAPPAPSAAADPAAPAPPRLSAVAPTTAAPGTRPAPTDGAVGAHPAVPAPDGSAQPAPAAPGVAAPTEAAPQAIDIGPTVAMWPAVLDALKAASRVAYTLADGTRPVSRTASGIVVAHPDKSRLDYLRNNKGHLELLRLAVLDVLHLDGDVDFVLDRDRAGVAPSAPAPVAAPAPVPDAAPPGPSPRERAASVVAEERAATVEPVDDVVSDDDADADGDLSGLALVQRELGGTVMTEYDNG
jgi:DNA polymerase-3 subunit gamma/tau